MKFILQFIGYRRVAGLAVVLFTGAVLDLVGIVLLYPYIELAANPENTIEKFGLQRYIDVFHIQSSHQFLLLTGSSLIAFYTLKAGLIFLLNRYQFKTVANLTYRLTEAMYGRLLRCRFNAFQQFPASQLIGVVYNNPIHASICMTAIATIVNDAIFLVIIFLVSISASPIATICSMAALFLVGVTLHFAVVRKTQRYGKQQALVEDAKHKVAFSTITAIKDIKVMGIENHLIEENTHISKLFFSTTWKFNLLGSVPKIAIEYFILAGLCLGVMVTMGTRQDFVSQLPLIGVGIAATMRIIPSFNRIILAINTFKFYRPFISKIIDFYEKTTAFEVNVIDYAVPFNHRLEVKNLWFSYDEKRILLDVSISIFKGQSIGIVGMSGSGKSTLLDLISGIQEKEKGDFLLDGELVDPFGTNVIRRILGYVPQAIALVDDSIAFNVSFSHEWDPAKLTNALKAANLLAFVDQLPDQEKTRVGENGVRLSGGQRQRIGIARALYKDPEILIFDEATSAVDNITEQELSREISKLSGAKTILLVAHRLSTIQHCDRIYVMHKGRIIGAGTYHELLESNELFQELHRQQASAVLRS